MTHVDRGLAAKRPGAGEHFVKQHAHRKDVRAFVDAIAARLFGRRVGGRAVGHSDFSQFGAMNPGAAASSSSSSFARPKSRILT